MPRFAGVSPFLLQSRTVTAFFVELATLTMTKSLIGDQNANGGTLSPAVGVAHTYDVSTVAPLEANADSGWGGTLSLAEGQSYTYYDGDVVALNATDVGGWKFDSWTGGFVDLQVLYEVMDYYVTDQFFKCSPGFPQIPSTSFPR